MGKPCTCPRRPARVFAGGCGVVPYVAMVLALSACGGSTGTTTATPPLPGDNPQANLLLGADPHAAYYDEQFWIYRTSTVQETSNTLHAYVSGSLSNERDDWSVMGPILEMTDIAWIDDDGAPVHFLWAPAIIRTGATYYLYFSVGPQNPTPSRIGVAVADNPAGPFTDSGQPLLTGGNGFEAIDPMVFIDSQDGIAYLYAGGSAGSTLRVFRLRDNMIEIDHELQTDQPENFTEAPFMHEQNGLYYLSYSNGRWNDDSYSVHYSIGTSPAGPWTYCGQLAGTDSTAKGPGHNSFLEDPVEPGTWHFIHHQWDSSFTNPPYQGDRHIVIKPMDLGTRTCSG